jgi:hypothetical protein
MAIAQTASAAGKKSYGVVCEICDEFICLWPDLAESKAMRIFVPGWEPVQCSCGASAVYTSNDVVDEARNSTR